MFEDETGLEQLCPTRGRSRGPVPKLSMGEVRGAGATSGLKCDTTTRYQDEDAVCTPRGQIEAPANAAWARLRTPSPQGNHSKPQPVADESDEDGSPMRCVLLEPQRGLPTLPRRWRTPDPSPTRNAMPAAKPTQLVAMAAVSDETSTPREQHVDYDSSSWARVRTPSPEGAYPMWGSDSVPAPVCFPLMLSQQVLSPDRSGQEMSHDVAASMCSTRCFSPAARAAVTAPPLAASFNGPNIPAAHPSAAATKVSPAPPMPPTTTEADSGSSVGTNGHPHSCGQPCKYFWKANGCKDGEACTRCHICKWTRPKKKTATVVTLGSSAPEVASCSTSSGPTTLLLAEALPQRISLSDAVQ